MKIFKDILFHLNILIVTAIFLIPALVQVLVGVLFVVFGKLFRSKRCRDYGWGLLIGVDQNANTFWAGFPDETISSRTGRAMHQNKPKWYIKYLLAPFIDGLFKILGDDDHTKDSIEHDEKFNERQELWVWHHVEKNQEKTA